MNWSLKKMADIFMLENNSQKISSINMKRKKQNKIFWKYNEYYPVIYQSRGNNFNSTQSNS